MGTLQAMQSGPSTPLYAAKDSRPAPTLAARYGISDQPSVAQRITPALRSAGGQTVLGARTVPVKEAVLAIGAFVLAARHRPHACVARRASEEEYRALTQELQGRWEDNAGLVIDIFGDEADFGDGTGAWK